MNALARPATAAQSPIIQPGRNCWRVEHASRFAVIVDAEDYFRALKDAVLQARHAVYLIGWDFDTRIKLEPQEKTLEGPNGLGSFLRWIDRERPDVCVFVLKWDLGAINELGRGTTPLAVLDWITSRRIRFKLDHQHPLAAAHHQKIAVIDDALAFCGGIDMTADRWDTREHLDDDPRRTRPSGRKYGPWHDAAAAVDGEAARALGELCRMRWLKATGEKLDSPPPRPGFWPDSLKPVLADVEVAIARTFPDYGEQAEVREIESCYLDAIAAARHTIYCESQYFASRKIAQAMARRLEEPDGPEIVIVNPLSADGFLEAAAMDTARARLLSLVRSRDAFNRFRIYTPVTRHRAPIYVHSKILVIDDRLLKIGSSNLNNRSMGFDTECDLAIEARGSEAERARIQAAISAVRNDLVGEHLGVTGEDMARRVAGTKNGSLIEAIESLINPERSLVPYEPDTPGPLEGLLAENELVDPERPPSVWHQLKRSIRRKAAPFR